MPPDFIIAGAPRSGTTWLYNNLSKNPRIFMTANKEPRYYSVEEDAPLDFYGPGDSDWLGHFVQSRSEYQFLYADAHDDQRTGEASSDYLYRAETAAVRIHADIPDARIIFILRNPAHRAYSNWRYQVQNDRETLLFMDAIRSEAQRIDAGWAWWWHYTQRGFYAPQLERFYDLFSADQILTLLYDEIEQDPRAVVTRASAFIGVDPVFDSEISDRQNDSYIARSSVHAKIRTALSDRSITKMLLPANTRNALKQRLNRLTTHRPQISDSDYRALQSLYSEDVKQLQQLTRLNLLAWLD